MTIYEPNAGLTVADIQRMIDRVQNSDYGTLVGGSSLDYATWQYFKVHRYEDFPCRTVRAIRDHSFEYSYGVHLPWCKSQDMIKYFRWCYSTFGPEGFEEDGAARKFWFLEEKNQTLFMLKWS